MAKMSEEEKAARAEARALSRTHTLALDAEDQHRRSAEAHERWEREVMYMTRDEALAGEPCRSCGLPYFDGSNHERRGSMYWTPEEKAEYEAEDAAFRERHSACRGGGRWTMSGSRAQHCFECCPPVPLSEEQARRIASLLSSVSPREVDFVSWPHVLTCGHEVLGQVHRSNRDHRASGVQNCPECGVARGVVSVARVDEPYGTGEPTASERHQEVNAAHSEVARLRKELRAAEARLAEVQTAGPMRQGAPVG